MCKRHGRRLERLWCRLKNAKCRLERLWCRLGLAAQTTLMSFVDWISGTISPGVDAGQFSANQGPEFLGQSRFSGRIHATGFLHAFNESVALELQEGALNGANADLALQLVSNCLWRYRA